MEDDDWKRALEVRVSSLETNHAVYSVHMTNLEKSLTEIKNTLTWLARLVLGALLLAFVSFIINGGISIG